VGDDLASVYVDIYDPGGQTPAPAVYLPNPGRPRLARGEPRRDPPIVEQQRATRRRPGLRIEEHGVSEQKLVHGGANSTEAPASAALPSSPAISSPIQTPRGGGRSVSIEEDLSVLAHKINQLKLAYERYFLGSRPREPVMERAEVDKLVMVHSNRPIQNTALRFKFASICSRYQAFKRQWNDTLRRIEQGTYERHRFKADLHGRGPETEVAPPDEDASGSPADSTELFAAYVEARKACGQSVENLSPEALRVRLGKHEKQLRGRHGDAEIRFRVVVEDGKAKLKATRSRLEA
jgi:hypothetical protein